MENVKWALVPCFMPVKNVKRYFANYGDNALRKLDTFGMRQIKFRQGHAVLFNDCCRLYPKDKIYISKSYKPL